MYERLVEALRNMDVSDACPCSVGNMCDDQDCIVYQAADAIEELSSAGSIYGKAWALGYDAGRSENTPHWISVTERLPEDAGIYIICDCYGNVMSRHFCKKSNKFAGYWHANGSKFYGNPTHWMPLPEPPKEEI